MTNTTGVKNVSETQGVVTGKAIDLHPKKLPALWIVLLDLGGKYVTASPVARSLTEHPFLQHRLDEWLGRNWTKLGSIKVGWIRPGLTWHEHLAPDRIKHHSYWKERDLKLIYIVFIKLWFRAENQQRETMALGEVQNVNWPKRAADTGDKILRSKKDKRKAMAVVAESDAVWQRVTETARQRLAESSVESYPSTLVRYA